MNRVTGLYVSLWSRARVAVVDLDSLKVLAQWPTQEHPCEMVLTRSGKHSFRGQRQSEHGYGF